MRLGGVLAPPYDVIDDAGRDALYGRDLRNIVRIDDGAAYDNDVAGRNDRYTRAATFLTSWLELGVLVLDPDAAVYVHDHEFVLPSGEPRHRRGVLAIVPAEPWERSQLRPHERTLRAPKEDRLALMRTVRAQTSPVFAVWNGVEGMAELLQAVTSAPAILGGRTDGELGSEKHLLWRADGAAGVRLAEALAGASLYVADGHHRYETAVAYQAERASAEPDAAVDAPFRWCLVYLADAGDAGLTILPTHRLVRPAEGVAYSLDDLWARLDDTWEVEATANFPAALERGAELRAAEHAFAVVAGDGVAVVHCPRAATGSPRSRLDSAVLESEILIPAGVTRESIAAGGLAYTRDGAEPPAAVNRGEAVLGFGVQPVTIAEVIAVADAGETMPQKSTYFYPKVPTGLVIHPL